jgi:uncharacterized protein involved in exopolysaccharide biosynthesis
MVDTKIDADVLTVDEEEGLDLRKIASIVLFFLRAPKRRPLLATVVGVLVLTAAVLAAVLLPRTYSASVRILVQHNPVLPSIGDPRHVMPADAQIPTKGVAAQIMRRDNLVALVNELGLVERWDVGRPSFLRYKDRLLRVSHGAMSNELKSRALVGMLEQKLSVTTDQESVTISVDWADPQVAYDLVNAVYKNFLDALYDSDVNVITEAIRILEIRGQLSAQDVDTAIANLTKLEEDKRKGGKTADTGTGAAVDAPAARHDTGVRAPSGSTASFRADDETAQALADTRAQIRSLEGEWHRRLAEAQSQFADVQATLGPLHPNVVALKQKVEALRDPPSQLADLRDQERSLVQKLASSSPRNPAGDARDENSSGASASAGGNRGAVTRAAGPALGSELRELLQRDDATTAYARSKLIAASQEYNDILSRIRDAKVDLDLARASFKLTYSVARPAEIPAQPRKPNAPIIVIAGMIAAALLTFVAAGLRDLADGRFIEPWQVEMALKLPVLGELSAAVEPGSSRDVS